MTPTGADRAASLHTQPDKAVDKAGCATALWKARSARFTHRHPSRPSRTPATSQSKEAQIHPGLTDPARPNIITSNRAKQTSGGRHQIGTPAAFKSESVAGFLLECLAGFVGIRTRDWRTFLIGEDKRRHLASPATRQKLAFYGKSEYADPVRSRAPLPASIPAGAV